MGDGRCTELGRGHALFILRIIINDDLFLFGEIGGDVIREVGNKNIWFGGFRFLA